MFFAWEWPWDVNLRIMGMDAGVGIRDIEIIGLVLDNSGFAGNDEAVGEAFGDKELVVVFSCELHGYILLISERFRSNIYRHIPNGTLNYTN